MCILINQTHFTRLIDSCFDSKYNKSYFLNNLIPYLTFNFSYFKLSKTLNYKFLLDSFSLAGSNSIIFWIYPLVFISLFQIICNLICSLQESFHEIFILGLVVKIVFSDWKGFKLLNGIVVVSNLWESERFFVNVDGMDFDLDIFESLGFYFIFRFKSLLEMLFVERNAELVHFLLKFLSQLSFLLFLGLFLLLLLHQHLLLLFFFLLLFLFQSKLFCFLNLFFLFSFLFSFFFDFFLLSRFLISNCDDCFLGFGWF